jgi:hypothetical protein
MPCLDYFFLQAFSQSVLGHTFLQESAFSQVAQSFSHESVISQADLQQGVAAVHSVLALPQVFPFLLQHEVNVRAATAAIMNSIFFILFFLLLYYF